MLHFIICLIILAFIAFTAYTRGEYVGCLMPFLILIAGILAVVLVIGIYFGILKISGGNKFIQFILFVILGGICIWFQWKFPNKK